MIPTSNKIKPSRRLSNLRVPNSEFFSGRSNRMTQTVKDLDRKFEEQEASDLAKELGLPYFNLFGFPVDQQALVVLTEEQAVAAEVVPFYRDRLQLKIGIVNHKNKALNTILSYLENNDFDTEVYLVSKSSYENAIVGYKSIKIKSEVDEKLSIQENAPTAVIELRNLAASGPDIVKVTGTDFMSKLLTAAVSMRASDIHIQPEKEIFSVRFRIDGVLQEIARFHSAGFHGLLSRIKILAKMKLNVVKIPQDGSFVINTSGHQFEIRVSSLPANYGESLVLRLLGEQITLDIKSLGLRDLAYQRVASVIARPHGLVLTTGPTGSGKTTSLYAFLNSENKPGVKIITLENPIEYRLSNIEQIQIDEGQGLTFANALKSTMRQDPDIIMVGEIRDFDTAETAAQAALTGHMVYSTLHTNDAAGAIPRLLNLGVRPVTLAPALSAVIAQRLVRKICQTCKAVYEVDPKLFERVKSVLNSIPKASGLKVPSKLEFFHSPGCSECNYLGYKGRIGVFEVFLVDDEMQKLIFSESSTVEIKNQAVSMGMITMIQDGLLKASEGLTDLEEVFRVAEE